ncbi:MAG: DEAD/DEAH box helicase family protein [Planctomycetes bacterium]|nr:DEAD/DEAH box helicase family protein [Planctomycetota bacterium]
MLLGVTRKFFSPDVLDKGASLFARGAVEIDDLEFPDLAIVQVRERQGTFEVLVDGELFDDPSIVASCDCKVGESRRPCAHMWAAFLALDDFGADFDFGPQTRFVVLHPDDVFEHSQMKLRGTMNEAQRASFSLVPDVRPPTLWDTLDLLDEALSKEQEPPALDPTEPRVHYLFDRTASRRTGEVEILVEWRQRNKSGVLSKPRAVEEDDLTRFLEEDRRLASLLLRFPSEEFFDSQLEVLARGSGRSTGSRVTLPRELQASILPELCRTGRFVMVEGDPPYDLDTAIPLRWQEERWTLALVEEPMRNAQERQLVCELRLAEERRRCDESVLYLKDGVVIVDDRIGLLEDPQHARWMWCFEEPIALPKREGQGLVKRLYEMPHRPSFEWMTGAEPVRDVEVEPQGCLGFFSLEPAAGLLHASIVFCYGKHEFRLKDERPGGFDPEDSTWIPRDPEGERRLLEALSVLRPWPVVHADVDFEFSAKRTLPALEELIAAGWEIRVDDAPLRMPTSWSLRVTTGRGWFDVVGEAKYGDASLELALVLEAIQRKQGTIAFPDGSVGLLPRDLPPHLVRLVEMGQRKGKKLRFPSAQGLLLDALLAERNVTADASFERLRERIRSFQGIESKREPEGFLGELRSYQRDGLAWLAFLNDFGMGGCLADDMGLGKTVQVLAHLVDRRRLRDAQKPTLVVVPSSLVFNWIEEAQRFAPELRVVDYTGGARKALRASLEGADLVLTTYGTLRRDVSTLKEIAFDHVILDEAQAIKNPRSLAAKATRLLTADHRLAMTGTPVENRLEELWSLFEFLNPGLLGSARGFEALVKRSRTERDGGTLQCIGRALRPLLLRRTKAQVLTDLPEKTEQTLYCEMSPTQKREYEALRVFYRESLGRQVKEQGLERSKIHVLEALLRLRQTACHPGLVDAERVGEGSAKLETLIEQLDEVLAEGHKAIVFSQFVALLTIVRSALDERGIRYEYLDGRTRKRGERVARFQEDPACQLFLISLKAGGHGLNLTAAEYVFILDPWWNPAVEAQAVDRAHRLGQTRPVFAYRLIARGTIEERILALQAEKRELADAIVSADDNLLRTLSAEDLDRLLS